MGTMSCGVYRSPWADFSKLTRSSATRRVSPCCSSTGEEKAELQRMAEGCPKTCPVVQYWNHTFFGAAGL